MINSKPLRKLTQYIEFHSVLVHNEINPVCWLYCFETLSYYETTIELL